MNFLTDIGAALAAMTAYLIAHAQELDDKARTALVQAVALPSPVDQIVNTGELIYAMGADAPDDVRTLGLQLVEFASRFGWHGLGINGRGAGICAAFQRDLGFTAPLAGWPATADDPEPRAEMVASLAPASSMLLLAS